MDRQSYFPVQKTSAQRNGGNFKQISNKTRRTITKRTACGRGEAPQVREFSCNNGLFEIRKKVLNMLQ